MKMLNCLANYILGYPSEAEAAPAETTSAAVVTAEQSAQVPQDVELFTKEEEDDWLLIEKKDDEPTSGSEPSPRTSATSTAVAIPSGAPVLLTVAVSTYYRGESDEASGPNNSMDESWFVTPPPCFTSGSVPVETSPLENLLIEHPSMSVYHRSPVAVATPILSSSVGAVNGFSGQQSNLMPTDFRKIRSKRTPEPRPSPVEPVAAPVTESVAPPPERPPSPTRTEGTTPNARPVQASPRGRAAYSPYQQSQQSLQIRSAQKLVQRATCQLNKRDSMERTNKAREILSSRNKRQRRSDRMNHHSGANNNRKC